MKKISMMMAGALICAFSVSLRAEIEQPFKWSIRYESKARAVVVAARVPPGYYLYEETTKINLKAGGKRVSPSKTPTTTTHEDDSGSVEIYGAGTNEWFFPVPKGVECVAEIEFQGCRDNGVAGSALCFMPASITLRLVEASVRPLDTKSEPSAHETADSKDSLFSDFIVVKTGGGFMEPKEFLRFLGASFTGSAAAAAVDAGDESTVELDDMGLFGLIIFILLGGLALNLTPCVLPMMPINLAIIGAGGVGISRRTGFLRGGVYGLAIAVSYGALGLFAMFVGARFGSLNSSPWFNLAIAVVFLVLALAMFDVITIDFSRYGANLNFDGKNDGTPLPAVFAMGVVSALLAGACVAPVVIAVLLYSTTKYSEGNSAALLLPFLLGIGMALPWPLVGGGLASLPKPGKWMVRVKQAMGVFIVAMALYYAWLGVDGLSTDSEKTASEAIGNLKTALVRAKRENRPVFIDFWATWCKNCSQMERSTFRDEGVERALRNFVVVKFQAENPRDPEIGRILDEFNIMGLPGYVVLRPKK